MSVHTSTHQKGSTMSTTTDMPAMATGTGLGPADAVRMIMQLRDEQQRAGVGVLIDWRAIEHAVGWHYLTCRAVARAVDAYAGAS